MIPDYDYEVQTSNKLDLLCIFSLLCSCHRCCLLCYCCDQKTGIAFTGSFNFTLNMKITNAQISRPKIDISMLKTACTNPCQNKEKRCNND